MDVAYLLQVSDPLLGFSRVLFQVLILADITLHLLHVDVVLHIADGLRDELLYIGNG